jgi:murein DD-endopeptidase MepM/ murein hydrolase activator NlpD
MRSTIALLLALAGAAHAEVTVTPMSAHPGDAVLVSVTGTHAPHGKAEGASLAFWQTKTGYQAVFAIPLDAKPGDVAVAIDGAALAVKVVETKFPETSVIVEDELANPIKVDRDRIDADNAAIIKSFAKADGAPQFAHAFKRPPGETNSTFGEWRTFNDGHKSQHLGLDLFAREGTKVAAIDDGIVVLVREGLLSGNTVVVAHGGGIASAYFHLSEVSVKEGDTVELGRQLGLAGHTGRTTGPHLHLSVRVHGGLIDPTGFLKLPIAPPSAPTAKL